MAEVAEVVVAVIRARVVKGEHFAEQVVLRVHERPEDLLNHPIEDCARLDESSPAANPALKMLIVARAARDKVPRKFHA